MLYTEEQQSQHVEEILGLLYEIALHDSRIPIVLPQPVYTEEAALAVRAFQQAHDLPVTGAIDEETWNVIVAAYHAIADDAIPLMVFPKGSFVMQTGDQGDLVHLVQVLLEFAGHHYENLTPIPVTGVYDEATEAAVRQLQGLASIPVTGTIDRKTWNALAALMNSIPL